MSDVLLDKPELESFGVNMNLAGMTPTMRVRPLNGVSLNRLSARFLG